jgi:hypothetical protein
MQAGTSQPDRHTLSTTMPNISVFTSKRVPGLKRLADLQNEEILPLAASVNVTDGIDLEAALRTKWDTDAHFVMYAADDGAGEEMYARINKGAFVPQLEQAGGRVVVRALVFDHDLPRDAASGEKQEWSAESLDEFLGSLSEAVGDSTLEPTWWYTTLHGSRFVYVLDEPVGPQEAEAMMLGIMDEFRKRGIELDDACKDWTRMFRLPHVEREGHGRYESMLLGPGPLLDPAGVPRGEVQAAEAIGEVDQYVGAMPTPDEVAELLEETKENGRKYKTELVKRAKMMLQGRDVEGIVFEHKPIVRGDTNWNNQVLRAVSSVVGMMSEEACTSPEGIYALLHSSVEQIQDREMRGANETDWFTTTWDMICRIWAKEDSKLAARRAEHEARQAQADVQRESLLDQLRTARPGDVPTDEEEAKVWQMRRMIASSGSQHYVMRTNGDYNINPCPDSLLIPMIRRLGMEDIIPVTEISGKSLRMRSTRDLLSDHAMPIVDIEASVLTDIAYIDGEPGFDKLHIPVYRLNPKLARGGRYDARVDEWLEALGGEQADRLKEWLSHSLDVRRAICALNLYGAPGTGKGMLAAGLAECFESMRPNDHKALGLWNGGLLENPVVNCDEGVPTISSGEALSLDQAFRSLVTGGNVTIRKMRTDPFSARIYPRILFTSNDRDIIRSIVGNRDLTDDDTEAIEMRLLSIEVSDAAKRLLTSRGNFSYTRGWIAGDRPSQLVLANHIKWLYNNRGDSLIGSGRLLVEGDVSTRLVKDLRLTTRGAETVLRVLVKLIAQAHGGSNADAIQIQNGGVFVTAAGVQAFAEANMIVQGGITLKAAGAQLRRFSHESEEQNGRVPKRTIDGKRGRWFELDLEIVYEQALIHGMNADQVRRLLCEQLGGVERAEAIEAAVR